MTRSQLNLKLAVLLCILLVSFTTASSNISKVYIVFSNHFDCGYTLNLNGSTSAAVINQYFHEHFPRAIRTANEARSNKGHPYKWMTQSWLIDTYHHCNTTRIKGVVCPNASAIASFDSAVKRGDINYHAFPFNAEPEMYTAELFDAAINSTHRLDQYYGHRTRRTLSQRDVPGLTRNAIPLLANRGIRAVSVGENSQVAPSAVPPIFLWKNTATHDQVIGMFHALGYGGSWPAKEEKEKYYMDDDGQTVVVRAEANLYDDGPGIHVNIDGSITGNSSRSEACVSVEEAGVALCYAWKVDNSGPHDYWASELIFDVVKNMFPGAKEVVASDAFDDFIDQVWEVRNTLKVVEAEIGDTWMMGADADPLKVALFRSASRVHQACVRDGNCVAQAGHDELGFRGFERLLMLTGEHTWGWNGGDLKSKSWTNAELQHSLNTDPQFQTAVLGWLEQRSLLRGALSSLSPSSPLAKQVAESWQEIEGAATKLPFTVRGQSMSVVEANVPFTCGGFSMTIGQNGAVVGLEEIATGTKHADTNHSLYRLWYQGMDSAFFKTYVDQYIAGVSSVWPEFTAEGLYKPNLKEKSLSSNATVVQIHSDRKARVVIKLSFDTATHTERGAPAMAEIEHVCEMNSFNSTLRWFNKTKSHAPETIWMSNIPLVLSASRSQDNVVPSMLLDKMGTRLNALDVDLGCDGMNHLTCGIHLHGVGDGGVLILDNEKGTETTLVSLDSSLVSVGIASPVPTPLVVPDIHGGVHFPLVGNIWNTNYPFWYPFAEEDTSSQFRFKWHFKKKGLKNITQ